MTKTMMAKLEEAEAAEAEVAVEVKAEAVELGSKASGTSGKP